MKRSSCRDRQHPLQILSWCLALFLVCVFPNVNVAVDWLPRATTAVQARAYTARYLESARPTFVAVDNLTDHQNPNTGLLTSSGSAATLYRLDAGRTARVGVRLSWTQ